MSITRSVEAAQKDDGPDIDDLIDLVGQLRREIEELNDANRVAAENLNEIATERDRLVGEVNDLTGQRNALVGQVNELTGERNALVDHVQRLSDDKTRAATGAALNEVTSERNGLVGLVNDLTGERNALAGSVNALTGERNALVGRVNELTGERNSLVERVHTLTCNNASAAQALAETTTERNALTGKVNELTGERNALAGRVNELTGEHNSLVGQVSALTAERNALVGKISDLTAQHAALFSRLAELAASHEAELSALRSRNEALTAQVNKAVGGIEAPASPFSPAPIVAASLVRKSRRAKFLIVSNMRSGSTWLQTLLGGLPDVVTDREIKLGIGYSPLPAHHVVEATSTTISDMLSELPSEAPVAGSKFVFDPTELTRLDRSMLRDKIGPDVRIIHLVRPLREVFLSRRRGFFHQLNMESEAKVGGQIRQAILDADPSRSLSRPKPESTPALDCVQELRIYVENDGWAANLRHSRPYFLVRYEEIASRAPELVTFIQSEATAEDIRALLAQPPVVKLPAVAPESLVSNLSELDGLFGSFEAVRSALIKEG